MFSSVLFFFSTVNGKFNEDKDNTLNTDSSQIIDEVWRSSPVAKYVRGVSDLVQEPNDRIWRNPSVTKKLRQQMQILKSDTSKNLKHCSI
jgi:hypothetical protein